MSLTPEQIADGWKPHDGGPCPVEGWIEVDFMTRNGAVQHGWTAVKIVWPHDAWIAEAGRTIPHSCQVIAYKEHNHD